MELYLPINSTFLLHNPIVDCGLPSLFLNGTVTYQNTTERALAYYRCDSGFTLEGNITAVCGADGNWSSTPVCSEFESGTRCTVTPTQ